MASLMLESLKYFMNSKSVRRVWINDLASLSFHFDFRLFSEMEFINFHLRVKTQEQARIRFSFFSVKMNSCDPKFIIRILADLHINY